MRDLEESDLHIALDEIERSDGHVSETTTENTAGDIGSVEGRGVHLDLAGLAWRQNQWRIDLLIPLMGFDHGGFSAWWAAWIEENDGQHGIYPLCVL